MVPPSPPWSLRLAQGPEDDARARELMEEYARSLDFSLSFQNFHQELEDLPVKYHPPLGAILLAEQDGKPAGCVALRTLEPGLGEMKRLYVRPAFKGLGLGRALAEGILAQAAALGLGKVRLDTVPSMTPAIALYRSLGFREIEAYRPNPVPGALYFEVTLPGDPSRLHRR